MFAQWLVQEQMDQVLADCAARGVSFYLDLPLGVNPDGYDVWANQKLFVHDASVGAPPDVFFTKGQDWSFPPLHPQRIREDGYRYVIDYLRFQMRHTGLLRLDHVMGLHRLWWVPRGASAAEGAYVGYNAEELYAILCLESHRHQTMLVGENLGTVPAEVNRSMKRRGLRSMYVVQYEARPNPKRSLRKPPRDCVASLNTHDMPTFAAFWKGLDIVDRQRLGLLKPKEARAERKRRTQLREALVKFLGRKSRRHEATGPRLSNTATAHQVLLALLRFLARSEAEVVLVNLEDLWLETEPQNTPGTSTERVNWKRKMRFPLDDFLARAETKEMLASLRR
jgi:4-alpha-glucanotransferase